MRDTLDVKPQSNRGGLGIAALVVALAATLLLLAAFGMAFQAVSSASQTRPVLATIGMMMLGGGLLELLALGLGIASLRAGRHKAATAGTAIAGIGLALLLIVILAGVMGRH